MAPSVTAPLPTRLADLLRAAVEDGTVPGLVAVVARDGEVSAGAFGSRDTGLGADMTVDTEFRIASMTKLVTAVAVLQAVEDGLVELDTQVGDVVAEFDELGVLVGFDGDRPLLQRPCAAPRCASSWPTPPGWPTRPGIPTFSATTG